ncbi:uncharacterized protein TEOVI_000167700 [Trypanosoma equiperdum]|uniref:Elks delta-like protein n=4 Tax=Trypanozoon TaxID=39700 RepID=Q38AE0_TRYB2|nr:hypothetical protein, conserved [Trypanosoma brucei gambiense DAL972]XP_823058.1 hypothetical protein, conserved [Trypanosoma brucei brucei TREU927]RHW68906.1 hypothetical protein DPX39_100089800 [Trypanosoma brucei equiperdum]SCU70108.1 hypothetical protein, conserved [Trypanosoma equiperdum]EAN78230.1 hypothetical protein, conserved [Trypanosoma brucei brucei TREU927]CBH15915.1 hypothetical protein, conserved [Trypanosoma brucei gambiense DAL972]|eukprot:XP_011778179.1 hypothetical protein, conserved [Trypanosoma brucei gambiense DAL972]
MDAKQRESIEELKEQLRGLEEALLIQEKVMQQRNQVILSLSSSIADAENSIGESKEGLKKAEESLEEAIRSNTIAHTERLVLQEEATKYSERDEYLNELSEADAGLNAAEAQVKDLVIQINDLSREPQNKNALQRVTLVRLISMLNDLHASLKHSVQCVPHEEDNRAREVLKAIRELSRERERTFGHCLRKKREIMGVMELKKQRTDEILLESKKNVALLRDIHEKTTLDAVEKIQKERNLLQEELENIKRANQLLQDTLGSTECLCDTKGSDSASTPASISMNVASCQSTDVQKEREHLREYLRHLEEKVTQLRSTTDELRESVGSQMEKNTLKLKDLRHQVRSKQNETHRLENENRKLKSLCDSLASTLGPK